MTDVYFAIPGDIDTLTGGYAYDKRLIAELRVLGLTIEHLQLSKRFPVPDAAALADAAAQFAALPDGAIVIVDGLAFGVMDSIAAQHAQRLIIIALCHHPLMLETGLSSAQVQQLFLSEQRALHSAKAVIVTSRMTANILIDQFVIPAARIVVALPGTDAQPFAPCIGNPPVLLTLATLTRRKGHDVLIDALSRIQHLEWCARFVGGMHFDPAWAQLLQQKVNSFALSERISFVGSVENVASEYSHADLFVLPSLFEGYGMAFAEALSFGLPIVAARAGAVPDLVPDSAGILVPPNDSIALADALQTLLADAAQRKHYQAGAQVAARNLPTWNETALAVARLINNIQTH